MRSSRRAGADFGHQPPLAGTLIILGNGKRRGRRGGDGGGAFRWKGNNEEGEEKGRWLPSRVEGEKVRRL